MVEYIERETVIQRIRHVSDNLGFENPAAAIESVIAVIQRISAIEAEPVRHGRWVYDHWCEFKCSVCGEWSKSEPYRGKENYCPNCGAKMDKENEA